MSKLALSHLAALGYPKLNKVFIEQMKRPSIEDKDSIMKVDNDMSWIISITDYMKHDNLPTDQAKAKKVKHRHLDMCYWTEDYIRGCTLCRSLDAFNHRKQSMHFGRCTTASATTIWWVGC